MELPAIIGIKGWVNRAGIPTLVKARKLVGFSNSLNLAKVYRNFF